MNNFLESLNKRGILETLILSSWLFYRKLSSFLQCTVFLLRGYHIGTDTMFYGNVWLQRGGKDSFTLGKKGDMGGNVKIRCFGKGKIQMGNHVSIGEGTIIHAGDKVIIGSSVVMGAYCYINDTNHTFKSKKVAVIDQGWTAKGIVIEDEVWLGAHVTILDGVKIGRGAVIGAGAVVTKDIPSYCVAAGVPAKILYKR